MLKFKFTLTVMSAFLFGCFIIIDVLLQNQKKVREKSRECHNHKPQPFPDPRLVHHFGANDPYGLTIKVGALNLNSSSSSLGVHNLGPFYARNLVCYLPRPKPSALCCSWGQNV